MAAKCSPQQIRASRLKAAARLRDDAKRLRHEADDTTGWTTADYEPARGVEAAALRSAAALLEAHATWLEM